MSSLTLSVPMDLKRRMDSFKYINWSEIARSAIIDKIYILEKMNKLLVDSKLTEEDTIKFGRTANKNIWKKHNSIR